MFAGAFQNGLKLDHFNELLAQKPTTNMKEVMKIEESYIKGEERNMEKISRDAKEKTQFMLTDSGPRKNITSRGQGKGRR